MDTTKIIICLIAGLSFGSAQSSPGVLSSLTNLPLYWFGNDDGIVFDAASATGVTICGFDLALTPGIYQVEVFRTTNGASFVGQTSVNNWTLVGAASVTGLALLLPTVTPTDALVTPIVIPGLAIPLTPGGPSGIAIRATRTSALGLSSSIGISNNNSNSPPMSNSDLWISVGEGLRLPFMFSQIPRAFAGRIYYTSSSAASCSSPRPAYEYQFNHASAGIAINNVLEPVLIAPITALTQVFTQNVLTLRSNRIAAPFDLVLTPTSGAVSLAGAGLATPNQQTVNVDLAAPGLFFVLGGTFPDLVNSAFPPTDLALPFAPTAAGTLATQLLVADPTHPDGFVLSHAGEVRTTACTFPESFAATLPVGWSGTVPGQISGWNMWMGPLVSAGQLMVPMAAGGAWFTYAGLNPFNGTTYELITCSIATASYPNGQIAFSLYRAGATGAVLTVHEIDPTGTVGPALATYTGASAPGIGWTNEVVSLIGFSSQSLKVLFRATVPAGSALAIDEVNVF